MSPPLSSLQTVTAALSAVAASAYLDARLNLRSDIRQLWIRRAAFSEFAKASQKGAVSCYDLLEDVATKKGADEAIWSHTECLSYAQTYARTCQYAQWFLAQGVAPGDHVVFYMLNTPDMLCAWLGLMAIGAAPALINTNLASKALVHCVEIAQARLILAAGDGDLLARLEAERPALVASGHQIVHLDAIRDHVLALEPIRPSNALRKGVTMNSPLALAYTSGTTGLPKAIVFPMVIGYIATIAKRRALKPNDRSYNCMPYYHLTGGLHAIQSLCAGETTCVAQKFSARSFWSDIRASRATSFVYVGETLRYLLAQPPDPAADRAHGVTHITGNGLRADVWVPFRERFGIDTINEFYNSTELMFGLQNASRGDFTARALGQHGALLRWLHRDQYVAVAVDAETGLMERDPATGRARRVPLAQGGEILVRLDPGSAVFGRDFRGYWRNEEATSKKIARDVFRAGDAYYRTGDALRRDADGRWFFHDRLGDTFRWKGENVSTTEVADALGGYPGVVDANVYGVQLPGHDGRAGAVALVVEEGQRASFDFAAFLKYCRARLPKYAIPLFIRLTNTPYSTANHKQNKVPLKTEGVDPDRVSHGDAVYWVGGGGKGDTYVPFTREDWRSLQAGKAKL